MMYLSRFTFPDIEREYSFTMSEKRTCYDTFYPFQVLSKHGLRELNFAPITILYGGNGCGKTTALNVIGETLNMKRDALYNRSNFFADYTAMCDYELEIPLSEDSRIITSDDVFDFMLNLRTLNEGVNDTREELFEEYRQLKYQGFKMKSLDDYEQLKRSNAAKRKSQSAFVRENLSDNVREHSNGESAYLYFTDKIRESGLYLLDEPENSISPQKQQELLQFLEDSVRFFGCQFIIATHSPFILAIKDAIIYDMDEDPVDVKKWTELENVRTYYEFFRKHEREFSED